MEACDGLTCGLCGVVLLWGGGTGVRERTLSGADAGDLSRYDLPTRQTYLAMDLSRYGLATDVSCIDTDLATPSIQTYLAMPALRTYHAVPSL
eukprot:2506409-Rhodomonas_salina.3